MIDSLTNKMTSNIGQLLNQLPPHQLKQFRKLEPNVHIMRPTSENIQINIYNTPVIQIISIPNVYSCAANLNSSSPIRYFTKNFVRLFQCVMSSKNSFFFQFEKRKRVNSLRRSRLVFVYYTLDRQTSKYECQATVWVFQSPLQTSVYTLQYIDDNRTASCNSWSLFHGVGTTGTRGVTFNMCRCMLMLLHAISCYRYGGGAYVTEIVNRYFAYTLNATICIVLCTSIYPLSTNHLAIQSHSIVVIQCLDTFWFGIQTDPHLATSCMPPSSPTYPQHRKSVRDFLLFK